MFLTVGSAHGSRNNTQVTMEKNVNLINGMNNISILSATVGLPVIVSIVKLSFLFIIGKQRKPLISYKNYILNHLHSICQF